MRSWARRKRERASKKRLSALTKRLQGFSEQRQPRRGFSPEQDAFLREGYKNLSLADLTAVFQKSFGPVKTETQIRSYMHNHGIRSGRSGQFGKGDKPWNQGKKGYMGPNATSFKKGCMPHTKKKLWTERINRDGFIEISVPERNPHTGAPTRYKHKHVWLWECENGLVPKGHVVVFVDGDKSKCALENLMLVTRAELLSMNLHGYKNTPEALKPSVFALAKLEAKAGIRTCPGRGRGEGAA